MIDENSAAPEYPPFRCSSITSQQLRGMLVVKISQAEEAWLSAF
jgi:hypothetical protein